MIKLENPTNIPQAFSALLIQSLSELPTVSLSVDEKAPRFQVNGQWHEDESKRKQRVTFINDEGESSVLEGLVPKELGVEIAGAFKVVVLARVSTGLKGAFDKGSVSKSYAALELVRVVEVWSTATKKVYPFAGAPDWQPKAGGKEMDLGTGKVKAAA